MPEMYDCRDESSTQRDDNSSTYDVVDDHSRVVILAIWGTILSIVMFVAILGNGVVIGTLLRTWNTAGTKPGNILAFVLACCDLLHSTINTVFILVIAATPCVPIYVVKIQFGLLVLLGGGSNMSLCVISLNRYYVVAKPSTTDKTSRQRVKKFLILAWGLVLCTAFLCVVIFDVGRMHSLPHHLPTGVSLLIALCLLVILPILLMMVTYLRLFRLVKMRCRPAAIGSRASHHGPYPLEMSNATGSHHNGGDHHNGRVGPHESSTSQHNGGGKAAVVPDAPSVFGATTAPNNILTRQHRVMQGPPPDIRIAITLLILLGVFILCWTPSIILSIAGATGNRELFHPITYVVATVCIFIVPACNPVVYSLRNSQFRAAANEFLMCVATGARCGNCDEIYNTNMDQSS